MIHSFPCYLCLVDLYDLCASPQPTADAYAVFLALPILAAPQSHDLEHHIFLSRRFLKRLDHVVCRDER